MLCFLCILNYGHQFLKGQYLKITESKIDVADVKIKKESTTCRVMVK